MKDLKALIQMTKNHKHMKVLEEGEDGFAFAWQINGTKRILVMVGVGLGWDHVSVSCKGKTPSYQEMKAVKRWCFKPAEWAVEYHPPNAKYISVNDNVLHIWRPHDGELVVPPEIMV